jgi:hypothetical protein
MTDNARHVLMKVDGKVSWKPDEAFGEDLAAFKKVWGEVMKRCGLKNFSGGDGWSGKDGFHLELPDSKMLHTDPRAKACLQEYVRLTRSSGKILNTDFENDYAKLLKEYVDRYEKASKK